MANRLQLFFSLYRQCHRRSGGAVRGSIPFQVSRRIHFWSSSEETSTAEVETGDPVPRKVSVVQERKIRQAAPDWLPLVPGSSYWIPSEDEKEKVMLDLSEDKLTAFISPCGWPADSEDENDFSDTEEDDD